MNSSEFIIVQNELLRQTNHWQFAVTRLSRMDDLASEKAWLSLENYLNITLKSKLKQISTKLSEEIKNIISLLKKADSLEKIILIEHLLDLFRRKYLKAEVTLDFFADALNTRTSPEMSALIRACDIMGVESINLLLNKLGKEAPPILTYIDKGLGASILKAGLRLWDGGTINPVAVIKIVRHNLFRPTSLIHEAGHQVAHIIDWNSELKYILRHELHAFSKELAAIWSDWASEIAADIFAFVHTGYGAVAALHDVVAGSHKKIFMYLPDDPHPISYIRVLLGVEMCRHKLGKGIWDNLAKTLMSKHPLSSAHPEVTSILKYSINLLPKISELCLSRNMQTMNGKSISDLINPLLVHPKALKELEMNSRNLSGTALNKKALQLLAMTSYNIAAYPSMANKYFEFQRQIMLKLGNHKNNNYGAKSNCSTSFRTI